MFFIIENIYKYFKEQGGKSIMVVVRHLTLPECCHAIIEAVKLGAVNFTPIETMVDTEDNPTSGRSAIMYVPGKQKDEYIPFQCMKQDELVVVYPISDPSVWLRWKKGESGAWPVHAPVTYNGTDITGSSIHEYILRPILRYMKSEA